MAPIFRYLTMIAYLCAATVFVSAHEGHSLLSGRLEVFDPATGEGTIVPVEAPEVERTFKSLAAPANAILRPIVQTGPDSNRVTMVFLAEGFTAAEATSFFTQATNLANGFFSNSPLNAYQGAFNAYAIFVPSAESGSDHPASGTYKNTYFNSSYDTYGHGHSISIPPNDRDRTYANGFGKADALLALVPGYDIPLIIVNDSAYGGSGGRFAITSIAPAARNIAIHEVAHSFAGLGDEYTNAYPGYPIYEEDNTTRETNRADIKWNAWINPETPVPTPSTFFNSVGLFEGARYQTTGWYRPQRDCKMRTLTAPFCAVCSETLVKATYQRVNAIDAASPTTPQSIVNSGTATFNVTPLLPTLKIQWQLDGVDIPNATSATFNLSGATLTAGAHTLRAIVTDNTELVRNDPTSLLTDSITWQVTAVKTGPALTVRLNPGIILSYPATAAGYAIYSAPSVNSTNWQRVLLTPALVDGQFVITLPRSETQQYFRLQPSP